MYPAKTIFRYLMAAFMLTGVWQGKANTVQNADHVCGRWMAEEKNLIVEIYKSGDQFKAKIVWFRDDPSKPMEEWRDSHNPDPKLRSRKILGMELMHDLKNDAG